MFDGNEKLLYNEPTDKKDPPLDMRTDIAVQ